MKIKSNCRNHWQKKALCKQTALSKQALYTALSKQALYTALREQALFTALYTTALK